MNKTEAFDKISKLMGQCFEVQAIVRELNRRVLSDYPIETPEDEDDRTRLSFMLSGAERLLGHLADDIETNGKEIAAPLLDEAAK